MSSVLSVEGILFVATMLLATQASRLAPLVFSHLEIPSELERWLGHIPIAILAALLVPEFFSDPANLRSPNRIYSMAAALCLVVGLKSKNLLITTFTGIVAVAILRAFDTFL